MGLRRAGNLDFEINPALSEKLTSVHGLQIFCIQSLSAYLIAITPGCTQDQETVANLVKKQCNQSTPEGKIAAVIQELKFNQEAKSSLMQLILNNEQISIEQITTLQGQNEAEFNKFLAVCAIVAIRVAIYCAMKRVTVIGTVVKNGRDLSFIKAASPPSINTIINQVCSAVSVNPFAIQNLLYKLKLSQTSNLQPSVNSTNAIILNNFTQYFDAWFAAAISDPSQYGLMQMLVIGIPELLQKSEQRKSSTQNQV